MEGFGEWGSFTQQKLTFLEYYDAPFAKLKTTQFLLNKISHKFLGITKLFSEWNNTIKNNLHFW